MCGLAGILNLAPGPPPVEDELATLIAPLRHRGPDDTGVRAEREVGLAHARLSIVDVEGGRQPIGNEDGSVWVVFNGEIYNHVELRRELAAQGHRFTTRSDTEVIVHAYEQHGLAFVQHFNGQFAVALWDRARRRLVLARDRVGVRPLFYTQAAGRLLFASEIKALFQVSSVPRALDRRALADIFCFWSPLEPRSSFEGIHQVPPGHILTVDLASGGGSRAPTQAHTQTLSRFWDWTFPDDGPGDGGGIEDRADELRAVLADAVRLRLRADVPVGAYLSGGLDSSVIAALVKAETQTPLRTFSVEFDDAELDESHHQQAMVRHLGTDHTAIRCSRRDIGRAFPTTVWHAETTLLRTAPTPLLLLARAVRDARYKVVLTGEGADEVFGGYDLFKEAQVRRFWARRPDSRLRPSILQRLYPYLAASPAAAPAFAQSFFGHGLSAPDDPFFGHRPRWTTTRRTWRFFSDDTRAGLADYDPEAQLRGQLPADIARWAPLSREQYIEGHTLLSGYLLSAQGDRVALASSVEGRFPFLDHRVMELASRLPVLHKLMGLKEKHLLKRATADLVPAAIRRRPKQPYRAPDSGSFFHDGRPLDYVADLLSPRRLADAGYFDPPAVARLMDKCRAGRAIGFVDNMAFVGVLSTMLLDEMMIRRGAPLAETDAAC